MQKLARFFMATVFGLTVTIGLFLLMMALITINKERSHHNVQTTQVKVSSPPGFLPSTQIVSQNKIKHHQLPSETPVGMPINPTSLLNELITKPSGEAQVKSFATPASHQSAVKPGSDSRAQVKVPGSYKVIGPDPDYPETALLAGQEGWVETLIHLNRDGTVKQVEVTQASPAGVFELSVITAVQEWKIQTNKINDTHVSGDYFHRFEFKISR